jgi:hypothetical protein
MEKHEIIEMRETAVRSDGAAAFAQGAALKSCPHAPHTREAELWRRGFANAQFGAQASQHRGF